MGPRPVTDVRVGLTHSPLKGERHSNIHNELNHREEAQTPESPNQKHPGISALNASADCSGLPVFRRRHQTGLADFVSLRLPYARRFSFWVSARPRELLYINSLGWFDWGGLLMPWPAFFYQVLSGSVELTNATWPPFEARGEFIIPFRLHTLHYDHYLRSPGGVDMKPYSLNIILRLFGSLKRGLHFERQEHLLQRETLQVWNDECRLQHMTLWRIRGWLLRWERW